MADMNPLKANKENIYSHLWIVGPIVLIDGFVMMQGGIALIAAAWMTLGGGLSFVFQSIRQKRLVWRTLRVMVLYLLCFVLVFAINYSNNRLARWRAEKVIAAVERYKVETGRYPAKLGDLVPTQLESIPQPKISFGLGMFNDFSYLTYEIGGDPSLQYMSLPPFGRSIYHFSSKSWSYLD